MTNETTAPEPAPASDDAKSAATQAKKPVRKRPAKAAAKKTSKKTTKKKGAATTATKGVTTLDELCAAFLAHLPKIGKSAGTARSYSADLAVARKHFDADLKVKTLTPRKVGAFFASDAVNKLRDGRDKNPITSAKIKRVFRQCLLFGTEGGLFPDVAKRSPTIRADPRLAHDRVRAPAIAGPGASRTAGWCRVARLSRARQLRRRAIVPTLLFTGPK